MYPPRLTEKVEEHPAMIRIKGCKAMYDMEERKGAPASNAIARLYAFEEKYEHPDAIPSRKQAVWHTVEKYGQLVTRRCSVCAKVTTLLETNLPPNFCWYCGAEMHK